MKNFEDFLNESIDEEENVFELSLDTVKDRFMQNAKTVIDHVCDIFKLDLELVADNYIITIFGNIYFLIPVVGNGRVIFEFKKNSNYTRLYDIISLESLIYILIKHIISDSTVQLVPDDIMINIIEKEPNWIKYFTNDKIIYSSISDKIKEEYAYVFKNELF